MGLPLESIALQAPRPWGCMQVEHLDAQVWYAEHFFCCRSLLVMLVLLWTSPLRKVRVNARVKMPGRGERGAFVGVCCVC
jgi:hypothetical protein